MQSRPPSISLNLHSQLSKYPSSVAETYDWLFHLRALLVALANWSTIVTKPIQLSCSYKNIRK
jgi:hypothetical protein